MRPSPLLFAASLLFATVLVAAAPPASAACSDDSIVSRDCRALLCSTRTPPEWILIECWGVVGPPL